MYDYLNDAEFLAKLRKQRFRSTYTKLELLEFNSENTIREIQGITQQGSLSINGSSAIRRTINLTLFANEQDNDLENLANLISLNKKIKVFIGLKNPFKQYDRILWFPCGLFVVATANLNRQASGMTIAITGKDKMVFLDGTVGGTFPSSVELNLRYENPDDAKGYPISILDTIYEMLVHYGGEKAENIIINDLTKNAESYLKYVHTTPIYFNEDYSKYKFSSSAPEDTTYWRKFEAGDLMGYVPHLMQYPDTLIANAGDTVVSILNKISQFLVNFEFFYNIEGQFIFQEKKNYANNVSPLTELTTGQYIQTYSNLKSSYSVNDEDNIVSIQKTPKYENIKNDFIIWGKRTSTAGVERDIRFRLVIDNKPSIALASQYLYKALVDGKFYKYEFFDKELDTLTDGNITYQLMGRPSSEWREELYRRILNGDEAYKSYEQEMSEEWRKIYLSGLSEKEWAIIDTSTSDKTGRTPVYWKEEVNKTPQNLNWWLDFIDDRAELTQYSVQSIGRRSKVMNSAYTNTKNAIMWPPVDKVVFFFVMPGQYEVNGEKFGDKDGLYEQNLTQEEQQMITYYQSIGQPYALLDKNLLNNNQVQDSGVVLRTSLFEEIRELLYSHVVYQTQVNLTMTPEYTLEPNTLVYIYNKETFTDGNFVLNSINLPLTYQGTMSLQLIEAITRV